MIAIKPLAAPRPSAWSAGRRAGGAPRLAAARGDALGSWDDCDAMRVLMSRMEALRAREERTAATSRLMDALRSTRPILSDNVDAFSLAEWEMDHKLICQWHEDAWARLVDDTGRDD
ncbi:hypothetical protein Rsub_06382 [Raphidocelis subcapitata]|uniref:Uncharacterized protein n=1 Tax=Raphidocelis subcapitata TaxID=307507 RepID=A0A2V0P0F1_9CHLO|nr:hypothetical protein Rsub_06382 [Raphidocelis subcapitata]|eukprot:GBF93344.1 hypothetical protein Rsub_06382 [Raphidocelis subcapitata]